MSEKLSATIEVGLDGSKVEEGVAPIARTLDNLGKTARKAGKDAGDGIAKIGDGGATSAAKVESATRNMIGSIQRTTAALEAGTKSGAEYFESLARQRGVDPAVLRPYLAQLDAVREKQESAAISSAAMGTALKSASFAAVAAISGFATIIKGTIDAADSLNDLSKTTGIAVEQLAGLRLAAQQSGGDLEGIAKSINKLSMNIGKDGEKFRQLGIDAKDPLEAFKQLSDIFKSIEDPQTRAALGAAALGKSWESAAPLLSEGSKAIGEMVTKGTKLSGVTSQLTSDSDAFNDSIVELSTGIAGQFAGATTALLPLMGELAKSLSDASSAASSAPADFSPLAETFRGLIVLGGNVAFVFKGVGTEIGGLAAQMAAAARGDFKGAAAIGEAMKKDAEQARTEFDAWEKRILEVGVAAEKTGEKIKAALTPEEASAKAAQEAKNAAFIKSQNETVAAITKEESAYNALTKTIKKNLEIHNAEIEAGRALTNLEKDRVALINVSMANAKKSVIADRERILAKLDLGIAEQKNATYAKKAAEEYLNLMKTMDLESDSIKKQIETQNDFNAKIGLTKEAIANLEIVKLNDIAAGKDQNAQMLEAIGLETDLVASLREQAKAYRELASSKAIGATKTAEDNAQNIEIEQAKKILNDVEQESKRFYADLYNGLSDSLYRGFEAGKGFFRSFWDGIKNLFKTTVLKLAVQGVMTGLLGIGAVGQASAAQTNPLGQAFNAFSTGKSIWEGFSAAGASAGSSFTNFATSGLGQSLGLSVASTAEAAAAAEVAALTGSTIGTAALPSTLTSAGSAGVSAATAMPYVMAAIAAFEGVKAINGGYRLGGLSADAGALFGIAPRLFGMQDKQLAGQTVTGTLGTDSLMRNQAWTQAGGLFRSDRSGTWSYGLKDSTAIQDGKAYVDTASLSSDKALLQGLNEGYAALKAASTDYAKTLGLNADLIVSRNDQLNLTLGKTQEENAAAIQKAFGTVSDAIAVTLLPNIADFAQQSETASATIARLASDYKAVDAVFELLGQTFTSTGASSIAAREEFVKLNGGLDAMQASIGYFAENFLTDAERIAPTAAELHKKMEALGYGAVTTVEGFRDLVKSLDQTNVSQAGLSAELLKLAPAFKAVADAAGGSIGVVGSAQAAVDSARAAYSTAIQSVVSGLETISNRAKAAAQAQVAVQDKISSAYFVAQDAVTAAQQKIIDLNRQAAESMAGFSTTIKTFIAGLSGNIGGTSYADLKANLQSTAKAAAGGDATAQSQLTTIAQQFLESSKARSSTASQYLTDEAGVRVLLNGVASSIDKRVSDLNLPPVVDPMQAAQTELLAAQKKLADYSALAAATGSNMDRSLIKVADSSQALLAEFKKAREDNLKAQSDFGVAQQLAGALGASTGTDLSSFLRSLTESVAASDALSKAQNDLSSAIVKAAQGAQVSGEDFAKSLGLTGEDAQLLTKAIKDAGLTTDGYRALMSVTGLSAKDLAISLTKSGVAATDMALLLAKAGVDGEKFSDRLNAAGLSAEQFAAQILATGIDAAKISVIFDTPAEAAKVLAASLGSPSQAAHQLALDIANTSTGLSLFTGAITGTNVQEFYSIVGAAGLTTKDFGDLMASTGLSAKALVSVLGTKDQGLQGAVIAGGLSLKDFIEKTDSTGLSIAQFNDLLSRHGLTASSFDSLKQLTNSDAGLLAEYLNNAALSGQQMSTKFDILKTSSQTTADLMSKLTLTDSGLGLDALKSSAEAMAALLASFKLPVLSDASSGQQGQTSDTTNSGNQPSNITSINQKIVEGWYKNNPYANKSPDLEGISYWMTGIERDGLRNTKLAFASTVAQLTGTDPLDITKFATGAAFTNGIYTRPTNFNMGQMGEGGQSEAVVPLVNIGGKLGVQSTGTNDALLLQVLDVLRAINGATSSTAQSSQRGTEILVRVTRDGRAMQTEAFA